MEVFPLLLRVSIVRLLSNGKDSRKTTPSSPRISALASRWWRTSASGEASEAAGFGDFLVCLSFFMFFYVNLFCYFCVFPSFIFSFLGMFLDDLCFFWVTKSSLGRVYHEKLFG